MKRGAIISIVAVALACACGVKGPPRPPARAPVATSTVSRSAGGRAMMKGVASIGTAKMKPDRTIVLMLRAEDGSGAVGDALLEYAPSHPSYAEVLEHLGGLEIGEEKPVPPWDE